MLLEGIGFVPEPWSSSGRSFDLILLDSITIKNTEEFLKLAPRIFSDPKPYKGYEYTGEEHEE